MKICMLINDVDTEHEMYTTTTLSQMMINQEHTVYYLTVDDLSFYENDLMGGMAYVPPKKKYDSPPALMKALREQSKRKQITSNDIDVLFLRNDPSKESETRHWARTAGIIFGQAAVRNGVIVLNDPDSLSHALNKLYLKMFPKEIRPKSVITRNLTDIKEFFEQNKENIIIKPLQGSGGSGVFQVTKNNIKNLKQIITANNRDGYIIAQEYLPEAKEGDVRIFLLNGDIITVNDKIAALNRKAGEGDLRSNVHAGGSVNEAKITKEMHEIIRKVKPRLINDGMFLVGLDIIGNKLVEINVLTPGGFNSLSNMLNINFLQPIIDALIKKVEIKALYPNQFSNKQLATI